MKRFYLLLLLFALSIPRLWALTFESEDHWFHFRVIESNKVELIYFFPHWEGGIWDPDDWSPYSIRKSESVVEETKNIPELYDITIPSSVSYNGVVYTVTQIGGGAFYEWGKTMSSITIPSSIKSIGNGAFEECSNLESINFSEGLLSIGDNAFYECHNLNLTSITLPNSVTHIGDYAFEECSNLEYVYIGNNLTSVGGSGIFDGCTNLTVEWNVKGEHELTPLSYNDGIEAIVFGNDVTMIPEGFCEDMSSLTSITFSKGITHIPNRLCSSCTALASIYIPNTITSIGDEAFYYCTSLATIDIPASVLSIGDWAFYSCNQLSSVNFTEGLQTIKDNAFYDCNNLTSITLPNSVTHIGDYAFEKCSNLEYVYIGNNLMSVGGSGIFDGCTNLTVEWNVKGEHELTPLSYNGGIEAIVFGNDVTMIPEGFCEDMSSLASITFSKGITQIPNRLCSSCTALASIDIPNTITSIGDEAFYYCTSLAIIDIPASVMSIGDWAFYSCNQLSSVNFTEGLQTIKDNAFYDCNNLTSITLPNSVTHIGDWAFQNCSKLAYVQIDAITPPAIGGTNIFESTKIKSIHIPCGTIEAYEASDWNNLELAFSEYGGKYVFVAQSADTTMGVVEVLANPTCSNPQAVIHAIPYEGYLFTRWSDGNIDNPRTIILTKDTTIFAGFTVKPIIPEVDTIYYNATICPGESYPWFEDLMFGESGTYMYSAKNENGYDTALYVLNLVVLPEPIVVEETINTCIANLPYVWHGININESGHYTTSEKYVSMNCDSIIFTLNLIVHDAELAEETIVTCDSYKWNGETYTESGEYTYTTTAANGCDSIVTLHLTINKTQYAEETIVACGSYEWNGETYTESGEYTYTTTAANGCDSIVTLHLTINKTQYAEETIVACDSYEWNGETYTENGEYTYTTIAANGCDSIVTLHLTVNKSEVGATEYATICYDETYTWNGQTYAVSGEYSVTLTNAAGCDSLAVLFLTVLPEAIVDEQSISISENELPYAWHNQEINDPGVYTYIIPYSQAECDSVICILNVEVETDTLENKCGDDLYWIYDTGNLTITGTGDMYDYTPTSMPWQTLSKEIRTILLPDEISSIGAFAFADCYYLPSINIPSSVVTINDGAFENCRLLSTIRFANNGQLTTIGSWAFYNCHELKDVVIPEGVTEIGLAAFYGCANLKELTLPASLASIKDNGFAGCVKLSQMNVNAIVPPQVDARTFEDVDRSIPVIVPDESVEQYKSAPVWKEFNVRSKIGTGVENITSTTNNVQKIIRDGQLYILRDGKIYGMMGQEIK